MTDETRSRIERLVEERQTLIERLLARPAGLSWCREHTALVDRVVMEVYGGVLAHHPALESLAIVATGGYGREELAPYSDIDITVVPREDSSSELDRGIRAFFLDIHTALGNMLKLGVGYAYRLIADAPGIDAKSRTGLLDSRLIAGPESVLVSLNDELASTLSPGEFILEKTREREAAFAKYNATPLVVEPQLKEGAGGLRCFHCANWLRIAIREQQHKPTRAYERIVKARNLLHALAQKPQDLLTRPRQETMSETLDQDMYEMMSEIALAGTEVHAAYLEAKDKLHDARFQLSKNIVAVRGETRLSGNFDPGEAAVGVSVATALGLRVSDIAAVDGARVSGPAAVYAFSTGEPTLRNLDKSGLLEHLLPELTRCRTLMPRDTVHQYTVFEHTLQVIRRLDQASGVPWLLAIKESLRDLEPLYLAALLHDVGKYDYSRSHSEVGAEMALAICERFHLSSELTELATWLVREHLTMMRYIRLRDLYNPDTIPDFAQIVKQRERLDMLTLLTWADVNAVSPEAWTLAQETFLVELHGRTRDFLESSSPPRFDAGQQRQHLMRQLKEDVPPGELQAFVESLPPYYLASTPPSLVKLHYQLVKKAEKGEPTVETYTQKGLEATDFTVCTLDKPGLLSRLLGVLYAYDLSVLGIRACTTETSNPVALDTFTVSYGGRPVPSATLSSVSGTLLEVLTGARDAESILRERGKDPAREQEFFDYTFSPGRPGVLEVRAPRGRGMPYRFSRLIAQQGWNTFAARVGQWADSGAASFYIGGSSGESLTREDVDRVLRAKL